MGPERGHEDGRELELLSCGDRLGEFSLEKRRLWGEFIAAFAVLQGFLQERLEETLYED